MRNLILSILFIGSVAAAWGQELKLPAMSPTAKITQEFSTSSIEISYSRPAMRGRKIFGDVVAFGNPWRTGANAPTKIKIGEDLIIGDQNVKAGEYVIYTIPGEKEWEIILNKGNSQLGPNGYDKNDDVARFKEKVRENERPVHNFTIEVTNITFNTCKIEFSWENTRIVIPVKADNETRLNASIDKAINNPSIPYFQAANYYYETNQNLDKAKIYVEKAVEANPKGFFIWYLKAKIEKKLGHKEEAIFAANKSMETAKGAPLEAEYVHNNTKLINEINAGK